MNHTKTYHFQLKGVKRAKRNGLFYLLSSAAELFISKSWIHIGHKLQESEDFYKAILERQPLSQKCYSLVSFINWIICLQKGERGSKWQYCLHSGTNIRKAYV